MQIKTGLATGVLLSATALAANSTSSIPSSCSIKSDATISAQADLDKYSGCQTLVGNLTISGDSLSGSASLANVEEIDGSLSVFNATELQSFSADKLSKISGSLSMQQLTRLESASFGSLQEVDSIIFVTLPAINSIASNLKSVNYLLMADTNLESIDGFNALENVQQFNVNNNKNLAQINSQLKTVSDSLEVSFNGNNADVKFDNLKWANNITLRDVSSASFQNLQSVNASLGFINNSIESLNLTKLGSVGGTLSIISNEDLTEAIFSNLTQIGGALLIANNTKLAQIDGFSKLQSVGSALNVIGNFSDLELTSLKSVKGGCDVETKSSNYTCDSLKKLQSNGGIQGDAFVCKNGATSTSIKLSSTSGSSSSTDDSSSSSGAKAATATDSSSSSSSSKSKGAAAGQVVPASSFMGAIAAVAVALL
ncbi:LANO_0E07272g1_1 [Lachancea nothofagi CBS 11611]|uniref:LANO_0E07272g1_1 n=1 Tax=Lachancea nothofagi CBS 11611 TaxID=1266666 RepID=A0A1G4JUF2_9SACH|nr:LANO_0E07272g1_1 [Lachancea nothofagi CBS 11611]